MSTSSSGDIRRGKFREGIADSNPAPLKPPSYKQFNINYRAAQAARAAKGKLVLPTTFNRRMGNS